MTPSDVAAGPCDTLQPAMLSEDTINQVRDRANIVQIVGERVKLERAGRSYKGLCPFHQEKTPSFHVNEERNFYHCFGCHAHGDSIRFVQETEGLSFVEAIRELATRLGIEIVESRSDDERRQEQAAKRQQEELFAVNEAAASFFERCLAHHPLGEVACAELLRRGLEQGDGTDLVSKTLAAFRIGYAPHGWDGLVQQLKRIGLSHVAAEKVGLLAPRKNGPGHYDRFRHRLMFAITDLRGRVIGFSGRSLPEPSPETCERLGLTSMGGGDEPAKYVNSPESPIYRKREVVFGLFQARDAVRQQNECVLVEGNFDVMSLHARGIQNVVAPLGTAFTREQAKLIKRYSQNVIVLFDGDSAGKRATAAAREPCKQEGLIAKVASLPEGQDPDDLVRDQGPDALRSRLKAAAGMLEYLMETILTSGAAATDAQSRAQKLQEVLQLIKSEEDPTVRALAQSHADTIAARLGITDLRSMGAVRRAVAAATSDGQQPANQNSQPTRLRVAAPEQARSLTQREAVDRQVLGVVVEWPQLLEHPSVTPQLAYTSGDVALAIAVLARSPADAAERLDSFPTSCKDLVARHLAAPSYDTEDVALRVLLDNLSKLAARERKRIKAHLEEELREARSSGDQAREDELLLELIALSRNRVG